MEATKEVFLPTPLKRTFVQDVVHYARRMSQFERVDWNVYFAWIGLMVSLLVVEGVFLTVGMYQGVQYPAYVWNVPMGTFIFVVAIAFDTIGHRTVYKKALQTGEALVHHITIAAGISSTVLLCLAFDYREFLAIPAIVMVALSIFYSVIDEAMHWFRYAQGNSDRVEMWSHFFIFVGHLIMVTSWTYWFVDGYPGFGETLVALGAR
jgi:hypothetical protein